MARMPGEVEVVKSHCVLSGLPLPYRGAGISEAMGHG